MTTLKDLLDYAKTSYDPKTKGNFFERLIRFFLRNDPRYWDRLSDVWLWEDFPYRWGTDTGIDLVAREADTGEFWAIQCKFYGEDHKVQKADIDSFLSASGKTFETEDGPKSFALRVVVLAAGGLSKHAEESLAGQTIPAITDKVLEHFRSHYSDDTITKEAIFYYVYGALHDPTWREKYAADLKKSLPRIELHEDFWKIENLGRRLADLHLGYETVEPWPLEEIVTSTVPDYRVEKMRFRSKTDKSAIIYNHYLTLEGIPPEAHEYVVNGRSPVEWVIDRYQVRVDKETGIVNDPNAWCEEIGDERYIVDLIKRVVRVSVETVETVRETVLS